MAFHVKRTKTAHLEELSQWNGARTTKWLTPPDGKSVLEIQTIHSPEMFKNVPLAENLLIPPYHWHWYQEEFFTVTQGRYIFTLEGKDQIITPESPQPTRIPPRARHTFRVDPDSPTPCTIEISTAVSPLASPGSPSSAGVSSKFFRNLYSYLDDCHQQSVQPSVPQLLLMLHHAEVGLAFSWGPDWLMQLVSWLMGIFVGRFIGGWILCYEASYPEYWDDGTGEEEGKKEL